MKGDGLLPFMAPPPLDETQEVCDFATGHCVKLNERLLTRILQSALPFGSINFTLSTSIALFVAQLILEIQPPMRLLPSILLRLFLQLTLYAEIMLYTLTARGALDVEFIPSPLSVSNHR